MLLLLVAECLLLLSDRLQVLPKGYALVATLASIGAAILLLLVWFVLALIFGLRFQFSIRSLLLLAAVTALPFSWLAVEMKQARAVDAIGKAGGFVEYDWEYDADRVQFRDPKPSGPLRPARALHLGSLFESVIAVHLEGTRDTDGALAYLNGLNTLTELNLIQSKATDAGLRHLTGLSKLRELHIDETAITDAGLGQLAQLNRLQTLQLSWTQVTDAGLKHIEGMNELQVLTWAAPASQMPAWRVLAA